MSGPDHNHNGAHAYQARPPPPNYGQAVPSQSWHPAPPPGQQQHGHTPYNGRAVNMNQWNTSPSGPNAYSSRVMRPQQLMPGQQQQQPPPPPPSYATQHQQPQWRGGQPPSVALQPQQVHFGMHAGRPPHMFNHTNNMYSQQQQQMMFQQGMHYGMPMHPQMHPQHMGATHQASMRSPNFKKPHHQQHNKTNTNSTMNTNAHRPAPSLQPPPAKKQKKKDQVPVLEKITVNPVVRDPLNPTEAKEIEAWKAERRKNWPTTQNLQRKEQEAAARKERGELDLLREERRQRLKDILDQQRAMGLTRKAGTEELFMKLSRHSSRGRGDRGGARGRGGGRKRQHGWEAFMEAPDSVHPPVASHMTTNAHGVANGKKDQTVDTTVEGGQTTANQINHPPLPPSKPTNAGDSGVDVNGKKHKAVSFDIGNEDQPGDQEGLAALACYGSDDNNEDKEEGEQKQQTFGSRGRGRGRGRRDRGGGGGRGRGGGRGHNANAQQQRRQWVARPQEPSLLEKLLNKEIRQDRSYILQAIRFFVTNNFLLDVDKGVALQFPQPHTIDTPTPKAALEEVLAATKEDADIEEEEFSDIDGGDDVSAGQQQQQQTTLAETAEEPLDNDDDEKEREESSDNDNEDLIEFS